MTKMKTYKTKCEVSFDGEIKFKADNAEGAEKIRDIIHNKIIDATPKEYTGVVNIKYSEIEEITNEEPTNK